MGIKRYDIETWTEDIKESEDGKWVRYIDVDKLQAENKRLREALEYVLEDIDADYGAIISVCKQALEQGESDG